MAPRETRGWTPSLFEQMVGGGLRRRRQRLPLQRRGARIRRRSRHTTDAVRWLLRDNADRFGIDPSRVVLFGQSGGGLSPRWRSGCPRLSSRVQGTGRAVSRPPLGASADDDPAMTSRPLAGRASWSNCPIWSSGAPCRGWRE